MNTVIGVALFVLGSTLVVVGTGLAVAEIISGLHRKGGSVASTMAGHKSRGLAALADGVAAILRALGDWPVPALLIVLGFVAQIGGIWVLAAVPIQ
jgi:hypothetical protein